jgi:anhydro-N-acetylmuramic acid kinase
MMTAVGLMSGTSADGVSAAAVRIGPRGLRLLAYRTFPFPRPLRSRVLGATQARAPELSALHGELGRFFGGAAARFIGKGRVDVIGSHGQTVWHQPARHTLQLGEAAHIAERTGVTTVCDFRPADIAAGGQGAPLVPYFDWYLWRGRPVVLLNVGGIANLTRVGRSLKETSGFDTGPGNCLIDEAMAIAFGRPYDEGGRVAARGRIDAALLARLDHPYFAQAPPKSTGRELFSRAFLLERTGKQLRRRPADVVATLTFLTARTIADAVARVAPVPAQELIISGGGALNRTLVGHLEWMVWPTAVRPIDVYGFHPLAKEPAAFALLAAQCVRGVAANVPSATGARGSAVLGKIVPGKNFRAVLKKGLRKDP